MRDRQRPPGGRWGAQREVLPRERFVSSQQIGGNEATSMDNTPTGEGVFRDKGKSLGQNPEGHPRLEE